MQLIAIAGGVVVGLTLYVLMKRDGTIDRAQDAFTDYLMKGLEEKEQRRAEKEERRAARRGR